MKTVCIYWDRGQYRLIIWEKVLWQKNYYIETTHCAKMKEYLDFLREKCSEIEENLYIPRFIWKAGYKGYAKMGRNRQYSCPFLCKTTVAKSAGFALLYKRLCILAILCEKTRKEPSGARKDTWNEVDKIQN